MRKIEWLLIALTTVFVAVVLPTFNKGHAMEFGTTSDVVIAIANIVMASAAVYAAFLAKNWLHPNLLQHGLPKTVSFLQNEVSALTDDFNKYINTDLIVDELEFLYECLVFLTDERTKRYNSVVENINKMYSSINSITQNKITIATINDSLAKLEWYGYTINNEKYKIIKDIIKTRQLIEYTHRRIMSQITNINTSEFKERYINTNKETSEKVGSDILETISLLKTCSETHNENHTILQNKIGEFIGEKPIVTDFFNIKK